MANCMRCGREILSGQYCESCLFYATNDQCWRCRMYLPRIELQQWKGQTYCPYCIMEIRDEERRALERREGAPGKEGHVAPDEGGPSVFQKSDYECDKCKGDMDIAYVVADHKFCELCFEQQRVEWKKDGIKAQPFLKYRLKEDPGLFAKFLKFLKMRIRSEWENRMRKKGGEKE